MGWGKNDAADDEEYMCEDGWGKIPGIKMQWGNGCDGNG